MATLFTADIGGTKTELAIFPLTGSGAAVGFAKAVCQR